MRIIPGGNAREPDLLFLATEHHDQLSERELHGLADLIVEVVSEDSIARDRADKFHEYQAGGVREYWIIDSRAGKQRVDLYVLDAQGRYQPVPPTAEGTYHSSVLAGFWIKEEWLWYGAAKCAACARCHYWPRACARGIAKSSLSVVQQV